MTDSHAISEADCAFMREALALARQASTQGEVPVGAVVVHEGHIVGRGYNQTLSRNDPTAHAEMLALRDAARALGNYRLLGCTLYVTLEPCAMCAQAALHARLARVVYGAREPRTGAAGSVIDVLGHAQLNTHTRVTGGVLALEAAQLMQAFFAARRAEHKRSAVPLREDALRTPPEAFALVWHDASARYGISPVSSHYRQDLPALGGLRLHWIDVGPSLASPPWVCVHGPQAWWPQWLPWLAEAIGRGERCLVPDLIGFGQSDKPKKSDWHTPQRHAQVLCAWLDSLAITSCRLALAPGSQWLLPALQTAFGARIVDTLIVPEHMLLAPEAAWLDVPFPDAGHRAGPRALAARVG